MHGIGLDPVPPYDLLLRLLHIPQANIHQPLPIDHIRSHPTQPAKHILARLIRQTDQERHRHAMDIAGLARLRRVDVGMGIDPDDGQLPPQPLLDRAARAGDGTDGDGMVAAQGQDQAAQPRVLVHLRRDALRDGGDGARVLHVAVGRVGVRDQRRVGVDDAVMVEIVAELIVELRQETGFDQRGGGGVDAWLTLMEIFVNSVRVRLKGRCGWGFGGTV